MWESLLKHGWKWAIVGLIALIILPFVLATAHNMESGRDRDREEESR